MKHESCLGDTGTKSGLHCRILPNQNGLGWTWSDLAILAIGPWLGKGFSQSGTCLARVAPGRDPNSAKSCRRVGSLQCCRAGIPSESQIVTDSHSEPHAQICPVRCMSSRFRAVTVRFFFKWHRYGIRPCQLQSGFQKLDRKLWMLLILMEPLNHWLEPECLVSHHGEDGSGAGESLACLLIWRIHQLDVTVCGFDVWFANQTEK